MCILVCDGLKGLPEAVNTDRAIVQKCVIHLLRNTFATHPEGRSAHWSCGHRHVVR